jgi:hypothetical protein
VKVVARGKYRGEGIELSWSDKDWIQGPIHVQNALIDKAASITGTAVGIPAHDTIYGAYLHHHYGFSYVAGLVLDDAVFEYPEGEPEDLAVPEGALP